MCIYLFLWFLSLSLAFTQRFFFLFLYHGIFHAWQTSDSESESRSVVSDSLPPHGPFSPRNSPGQNTGVRSLSLLQGIFLTQEATRVSCIAGGFFTNWAIREAKCLTGGNQISEEKMAENSGRGPHCLFLNIHSKYCKSLHIYLP